MKKTVLIYFAFLIFLVASCKKSSSDGNQIPKIDVNYKGGTLHWNNANGASGSDPNFTFNITSVNANSIKLTISTNAPIFSKSFTLPLTDKYETNGSGQYSFSTSENTSTYSKTLMIVITVSPALKTYAQIDYTKTSSTSQNENFDGDGFN